MVHSRAVAGGNGDRAAIGIGKGGRVSSLNLDLVRDGVAYADRWVAYRQEWAEVPGIVVAICHDGTFLLSKGYGFADIEGQVAMTPEHIFRIASHSKTFTATAIMQLLEGGTLRLDDPLATYIPWLAQQGGLARVTIRQALNHSAGIVRDGIDADHWQLAHPFPDAATLRQMVEDGGTVLAANERFKYSNIAYGLLGQVIEAASGMPYNRYVTEHIVERLGLVDTGPEIDNRARPRMATGYTARRLGLPRRPIPEIDTQALSAATGFYSTAESLCRYVAAHCYGDSRLLSDASKREMQQAYWKVGQEDQGYGLGFGVEELGGRRVIGHGGGFPGYITSTLFDPKDRLAVVVLTNTAGGPAGAISRAIVQIIDFALKQPPAPHSDGHDHDMYTGRFVTMSGVTDVAAFGSALMALNPEDDDPFANGSRLEVEDQDTLRIAETSGYDAPGERLRYTRDLSGAAVKVVIGGSSAFPPDIYRMRSLGEG